MRWLAAGLRAWPLALLLTLAAPAGAHAQAAPALPAITLGDGPPRLDGEELGSLWLDATGSAGIDQVAGGDLHLKPGSTSAIHDFGDRGALWIHYRLALAPYTRQGWLITLPSPVLDFVRLWQRDADGQWRSQTAGDTVAVDAWPEPGRYPSFRLDLEPGQSHDVYLQVRSQTPTSVPVRLESEAAHAQQLQVEYLGLGVAFGALVLLIASCAAQSWAYRDRIYGWYAAYAAATMLGLMAYTGVAAHLLWTGSGFWADALQGSLALLATGAAVLFVRSLAGIAVRHRVLARVTAVAGPLGGVLALAYPFLARPLALGLVAAYMACAVALNVLVAWLSWRRRDSVGLWVLLAYAPLATAVLLSLARVFGWLPASFGTLYAIVVATALEVPLLLVALSIRARERHGTQIRELALSSQDALTGLLAPHLFHDRLRQVVARYRRDREDAAVVFIDLVNHGRIKAHYGSAVAEQSLLRSVIKLRRLLRDVDTVSRVAEARFGLILEGVTARTEVTQSAARLIAAGLMPLKGLKPDVTLQFHIAAVVLRERTMDAPALADSLGVLLDGMSARTRRPIRFLEPEVTQPAPLDDDPAHEGDEDSLLPEASAGLASS
ncbi:7TM diverse intracellular signaling domain-containing protein [uncultured Ramlibacter sp.]|mgnify:CR=1 FL=1|uniref:sensor domain-containing diguanylate cyclase n=1 Tax=uncultured Ramlibacter sp. TaxID=260755 RepID=UPI002625CC37|nr:7TM diverse intracellular signaling domain-containing protein [uncultured Ramlibacter sp.]